MQAKAVARTVRIAPRKARLVIDLIRGKHVSEAMSILKLTPKAASPIIEKVLKSGFLMPSLFTNYKWKEENNNKQEIRFYPFIPKNHLKKSLREIKRNSRKYWMFNYVGLDKLPYSIVYKK